MSGNKKKMNILSIMMRIDYKRFLIALALLQNSLLLYTQQLEVQGDVDVQGNKVTNVSDPTNDQDAATKAYVDALLAEIQLLKDLAGIGSVTDFDGNTYRTIKIGDQEWMVENLMTTKYAKGTPIPRVNNYADWENANYGAWCWYDTSQNYEKMYGKLYNWFAVEGDSLCPVGWHIPTDDLMSTSEWLTLVDFLGGSMVAGGKMKKTGPDAWQAPNVGATNESGFSGVGAGVRLPEGNFAWEGILGYWWTATESGINAWHRNLFYDFIVVGRNEIEKRFGLSIRCVRD